MQIRVKRIYEAAAQDDGVRILVDRLWPRGVSKKGAHIDLWLKEVAPTNELRTWFGHNSARWEEFMERYFSELEGHPSEIGQLVGYISEGPVTLVYSARDTRHNQAVALKAYLEECLEP